MAWIPLYTNLPRHDKLLQFQSLLRITTVQALGHLTLLWLWVQENSSDGSLGRLDAKALARVCQFNVRRADDFYSALVTCGFLDLDEQGLSIHQWNEYGGRYAEKCAQERERKRRRKERGMAAEFQGIEKNREEKKTEEENRTESLSSGAGGDGAAGPGQAAEYLDSQGLLGSNYVQASPALRERSDALTDELFATFCSRTPTLLDRVRVFTALGDGVPAGGRDDKADLLRYAFQQAAQADRPGVWPYIEGVLGRLYRRGINDRDAAEDYDYERAFGV